MRVVANLVVTAGKEKPVTWSLCAQVVIVGPDCYNSGQVKKSGFLRTTDL